MRIAVILVVVLGAFALYVQHESSAKMSAAGLERILHDRSVANGILNPMPMSCRSNPQGKWDYLCTNPINEVWGYNVNRVQVTGSDLVRHKDGTLVSNS